MAFTTGGLLILRDYKRTFNIIDTEHTPSVQHIIHPITFGDNANYVAVCADTFAGLHSGKVYLTTSDGFFVIDLCNKELIDAYTTSIKGRANKVLKQGDIIDFNVK